MTFLRGRGVKVELGGAFASAITVSALTNAKPGVAFAAGHGLVEGRAGLFSGLVGMTQIEGQAVQIDAPGTDTFDVGVDTTAYGAFVSGTFIPVASWLTLAEATSYTISANAAAQINSTIITDVMACEERGILGAQTIAMNLLGQTGYSPAMDLLEDAALRSAYLVMRITHPDGAVRIATAMPTLPGEDLQLGAVGTVSITWWVKGQARRRAPKLTFAPHPAYPTINFPPIPDPHPAYPTVVYPPPPQQHADVPLPPAPPPPPTTPPPAQTYTVDTTYFSSDYVA